MNGDFITTYTGLHFSPLEPKTEDICIADIAHALSLMTRANGHFKRFYSVAQHSINCALEARARGVDSRLQLACLLHDASEAYISDITRPVKKNLPKYLENRLQKVIYEAFGIELTAEECVLVAEVDDSLLCHEFVELMGKNISDREPVLYSKPNFAERKFIDTRQEFLRLYASMTGGAKQYRCVGIDGTRGGWIAACLDDDSINVKMFDTIKEVCTEYNDADCVLIDIPIGLPENKTNTRPDSELRKRLKGKASSVFTTPCRPAVYADDYENSNTINRDIMGKGLSKQSFAICDKIRETDAFLQSNPLWKNRLLESHPEYGFAMLNSGTPIFESKKTREGISARILLLRQYICNLEQKLEALKRDTHFKNRLDDIIDALCLAVVGNLGMLNGFRSIPDIPEADSKGLKMQIVFAR